MGKINNLRLWVVLIAIFTIVVLVLSCSQPTRNLTPTSSTEPETPTPSPPITSEIQASTTSIDISQFFDSDPGIVDNSNFPITPVEKLHLTGIAPEIDMAKYRLTVDGLVDNPLSLSYEEITQYPIVTEVVLLICPGFFVDNAEWTGVPVATILTEAGIKPEASKVTFYAIDGYQEPLSLEYAQRDGVFLAYTVDGQILPKEHGYPLRLVAKGLYGSSWIKWIDRINIS